MKSASPRERLTRPEFGASPAISATAASSRMLWTGRVLSGFVALFMLFDGGARLVHFPPYVEGLAQMGFPPDLGPAIGLSLVISTILYLIPRTAVVGAILLTGYLGGAAAAQVRLADPWFLFPITFGVVAWAGLYLREARLRELIPLVRPRSQQ